MAKPLDKTKQSFDRHVCLDEPAKIKILGNNGRVRTEGPLVQVSRLANPLVNELIINTSSKDFWNAEEPEDEAQFQEFYKNPSVAQALALIFDVP